MHSLVQDGGFMLTVNPCSDQNASEVCQSIVERAAKVKHDGVLVVERTQRRGRTVIDRPHVHWVLNIGEEEAKAIEKEFGDLGLNVQLTLVYDAPRLCWYLSKDPEAAYYIAREEDHDGSGTPPSAAIEQQLEGLPTTETQEWGKKEPLQAIGLARWFLCTRITELLGLAEFNSRQLVGLVWMGMARAP